MENQDHLMKQFNALGEALRNLLSSVSLLKESDVTEVQLTELGALMK